MNGADFLADVRRRLKKELGRDPKDKDLVDRFDITRTALHRWKNSPDLSALQMGALLFRSTKNEIAKSEANAITPLVEFLELHIVQSKGGSKFEIFGVSDENKNEHPYLGRTPKGTRVSPRNIHISR